MISRAELGRGIAEDEFVLLYQPQMTADGRTMASVEALIRWDHPTRGRLGPATFVAKAEECGMVDELGRWALARACADALSWPDLSVAVNISALQFRNPHFVDDVTAIVAAAGFPFSRLELEIVETAFIGDFDVARRSVEALRGLGIRIALDDFGTGYSSLTYLRQLPLDKIKVDRSFVEGVSTVQSASIVHAVVALSRALGLKVTAEGVETTEQHDFLRAAGCHFMQGYLFSRPLPREEVTIMLIALGQLPDALGAAKA